MSDATCTLTGTVDRILFQATDRGFFVFVLEIPGGTTATVRGTVAAIQAGEQVTLAGQWTFHPKFGKQFEATQCIKQLPTTITGIKKYLASGLIKGIGPAYAARLVDHFGAQVLEVIDKNPERLAQVPGIGKERMTTITQAWQSQKEIAHIMAFLQDKGISPAYATRIYKTHGQAAVSVIQENPYQLAHTVWGIGFKIADQIAHHCGIARDSLQRVMAGVLHAIHTAINNGNLYVELEELKKNTAGLLELDQDLISSKLTQGLHQLYDTQKITLITYQDKHYVTQPPYYGTEKNLALRLRALCAHRSPIALDLDAWRTQLAMPLHSQDVTLNQEQQEGVLACLRNKMTIITGGPGTGKTTLIKKLLMLLEAERIVYKLTAPTGRAAKRITEGTGRQATTLHRLLAYEFSTHGFTYHETNPLKLSMLIVDEASMLDVFLAHSLVKALPLDAHLVLIGDVDQLPSVGAGNFLNDCIASAIGATVRLKTIFRQAQDSLIIVNAHRVNNGEFPLSYSPTTHKDYVFIKEDDPSKVPEHLRLLFSGSMQRYNIAQADIQVLVPMNRGPLGTQALNHCLQQIINPAATNASLQHAGTTFKVGDRVMQIRNNYEKTVFNGDMGIIVDITHDTLSVSFFGRHVSYEHAAIDELVLAYAITIHKSQGSEYMAVILPIFMQHFTLLQRNLIYTALTRAKKRCIVIGQPKALAMAIKNNKSTIRATFLRHFLTTELACR